MIFSLSSLLLEAVGLAQDSAEVEFHPQTDKKRRHLALLLSEGGIFFRVVATGLIFAGGFALLQSATGRFLPHDLGYLQMNMRQLCGLGDGRVARFMFHDRVSFGGALIAMACLYLWLERVPLKAGAAWAWWTFFLSGLMGFGSFLAFLGYRYLDWLHALATLILLPPYLAGLAVTRGCTRVSVHPEFAIDGWWRSRLGWGRALLLATASGFFFFGTTIMVIGMTRVFVAQDLNYLGIDAGNLMAFNDRLLPVIAHDRAGFGGAVATCGLLLAFCVWFGQPSRSLWRAILLAGIAGFVSAIGVHPLIGYTDLFHLAPAYSGAAMFLVGILLCHKPMCGKRGHL